MIDLVYDNSLIPVVVQDRTSREVLMVAYANEEAVSLTCQSGLAHYYSRSRRKIWKKGEESGHFQRVHRVLADCDGDCLLYEVDQVGSACHTGYRSCFYRDIEGRIVAPKTFDPAEVYANKDE